jgi:selenide, water dikinase
MNSSNNNIPLIELILLGGGHAHIHVIKMFGMNPLSNVRITVIGRDVDTPYSGMLPGYIIGQYSHEECHIDIRKLCSWAHVRFLHAEVYKLDTKKQKIYCNDGRPPLYYDYLSINIGIIPKPLPGFYNKSLDEFVISVKPIDRFAKQWQRTLDRVSNIVRINANVDSGVTTTTTTNPFTIAVVGGGAGGVEIAFAVNYRLRQLIPSNSSFIKVILLTKGSKVMCSHAPSVQSIITRLLTEHNIDLLVESEVVDVSLTSSNQVNLITQQGNNIFVDQVFWCTQAMGPRWLADSGLSVDEDNCILMDSTLRSVNKGNVFVAGDVSNNINHSRPKAGVFAVRAGPPLYRNIKALIQGQDLEVWEPQTDFLGLITIGHGYAVGSRGGLGIEGDYLYKLKTRIDTVWMKQYQELPVMNMSANSSSSVTNTITQHHPELASLLAEYSSMRCGGCGAKVGASILSRALKKARKYIEHNRKDVLLGLGDDCAVVEAPTNSNNNGGAPLILHTVDFFRGFIDDYYILGRIAATHALSDLFAMHARPATALAIICLPLGSKAIQEYDLVQLLAGIGQTLKESGCALVGGHSSESAELALGLAVTGYVHSSDDLFYKTVYERIEDENKRSINTFINAVDEVLPGLRLSSTKYVIVLTKSLGTGVIFAAQMRSNVSGNAVSVALDSMQQSNQRAAEIFAKNDITGDSMCLACTDVTGFGLIGHLVEMLRPAISNTGNATDLAEGYEVSDDDSDSEDEISPPDTLPIFKYGARISLDNLPILPGARDCTIQGIHSSLYSDNLRGARALVNAETHQSHPHFHLLFDPQTSGGLLAIVRRDCVDSMLEELKHAGYLSAAVIGELVEVSITDRTLDNASSGRDVPLIYLEK